MKKYFLVLFVLTALCNNFLKAQTYQTQLNNEAFQNKDFTDIKGSPFSYDNWAKGTVVLSNNKKYTNLDIKYSEYEDKVFVRGQDQQLMELPDKIIEFSINYFKNNTSLVSQYRNGYTSVQGYDANAYFEVLSDGKTQFLKKSTKKVSVKNEYGSMETNKSFVLTTRYFIIKNNTGNLVKKDKKSIMLALADKQTELDTYIKANNIDFKKDEDIAKLVTYYNSI